MKNASGADSKKTYVNHPLLRANLIESRDYQQNIYRTARNRNTLIVMPTALGKTMIAVFLAIDILQRSPNAKILVLAPTRPLVMQHFQTFQKLLVPNIKLCLYSSNLSPIQRTLALNEKQIFFSTPQIIQNDLRERRYSLAGVGCIIFDEAHKARKNYAYTAVAHEYIQQCGHPLIIGLTASPGKNTEYINLLCEKLSIEQIVFREWDSPDVQNYIYPIDSIFTKVELPIAISQAQGLLDTAIHKIRDFLFDHQILPKKSYISKMDFIRLMQDLRLLDQIQDPHYQPSPSNNFTQYGLNYPHLMNLILTHPQKNSNITNRSSIQVATIMSKAISGIYLCHLQEILTTQDLRMFLTYLEKLENKAQMGDKLSARLIDSVYIQEIRKLMGPTTQSPKIPVLLNLLTQELEQKPDGKFIVFSQYREMASYIVDEINRFSFPEGICVHAERFVGQACRPNDRGLQQNEQAEMIAKFGQRQFNVLVATSVAEEGLDIPSVDAVIFYEAIPSEIRLIQRRGRTGRHDLGRCYFLVSPETLDQTYHIVSHKKEEQMHELLKNPGQIQTVPEISRTPQLPSHIKQSEQEILQHFSEEREQKELKKKQELEKCLQEHLPNQPENGIPSCSKPVNFGCTDLTSTLSSTAINHLERLHQNRLDNEARKRQLQRLTKKYVNWILSTMESLDQDRKSGYNCEMKDLQQAASEEQMDWSKIKHEIDKGVQISVFELRDNRLFYKC
jgi:Fanconi anemia group M protein